MCTSAAAALVLGTLPAAAQATGETTEQVAQDAGEIIVSARQRKETLIEAPVAVSAIDSETLSRFGATDTRDLVKLAPSLTIDRSSSGGGGVIALRGIGTSPSNAGFDQAVSINVDGIQTGRSRIMELGMLDLAQVEVMKGPQALFFGKNSPAGVISITSAAPTRTFEGYARVGYEFVADEALVEGAVSGPLSDAFSARVAVRYRYMDGWLRNNAGQLTSSPFAGPTNLPQAPKTSRPGDEEFLGRVSLAYEPEGSNFSATLKVAGMIRNDDGPSAGQQLVNCGGYTTPVVVYAGIPTVAVDPYGDCKLDRNYSNGALPNGYADNWPVARQNPYSKTRMLLSSLTANYDFENLTLTSVTGYFANNTKYFDNYDATVYMAYDAAEQEKFKSFSQEFRLLSSFDSPVNFMIGAYYQHTDHDFFNASLIAPLPVDAATGKYHTWEKPGNTKGNTYSVFGQLIWEIVPQLELAGGVRYTHETKDSDIVNTYVHPPLSGTVLAPEGKVFTDKFKDNNYSPEATLSWRPTSDLTTYIAYKTGYKSGGFGISTNLIPAAITSDSIRFKSEKIRGFEGGVKARLLDRALTVTSSIFSYKYSNLQVNSFNPATTSFIITNAAEARVKGVEVEFSARANAWLTFNGGIAYNHARFLDYLSQCWGGQTAATGCNVDNGNGTFSQQRAGQPLARAPDWTATAGFNLDVPAGDDFVIGLSGNTRYSDNYFAVENGNPAGVQDSFWLFDASVRLKTSDDKWEVALIGRNLTNEYYTSYMAEKPGAPAPAAGDTVQIMGLPNRGRQIMVQGTVKF
ncbi:TonB-dependent receptor [Sphingosinicella microcystinivorans]|uniref:TonB-dependent receptor n=1 Tax=Sphingosinicella microcystinivorans TaxID=335406 RepID=UPI0022F3E86E|nr:TonB-dependent receptor [Sphingosinicella microcystinivorans]WBX84424.1 TonB-dependent receptor [Sphingosinicella microcystinivorans]